MQAFTPWNLAHDQGLEQENYAILGLGPKFGRTLSRFDALPRLCRIVCKSTARATFWFGLRTADVLTVRTLPGCDLYFLQHTSTLAVE